MTKEEQKQWSAAEAHSRPHSRTRLGPPAHATFAACCLAFFVMVIFIHNHNSMAYVHSTIVYSLEAPAGWLQSTSRTTVRAVTIKNAAGGAVTRAALTATTTTTTVAAGSAAASSSSSQGRWKRSIISRWPRPQHSKPQQLAAATGNDPLPGEGQPARDIELHPQRVAQVVRKAKAAQVQQVTEEGVDTQSTTAAEHYAGLYGAGGAGSVVFESIPDMDRCPQGTAALPRGATAVVLLADGSSGAAVLKRSLDGLMLLYSQASADIRAGFHLYIGLDGGSQDMYQLAHQYALDSLGALKLVHNSRSSGSASTRWGGGGTSSSRSSSDRQNNNQGPEYPEGSTSDSSGKGVGTMAQVSSSARADHVRLMLHVVLQCFQYPSVLLLDDDWKLLPDFFEYFDAARWLLDSDPTLSCISAWNPLAQQHQHHSRHNMARLQRVDTNPGHGWLISRATGLQLINTWPRATPDFDLQQHIHAMGLQYGQQCVVPDVARMVPAAVHDTGEAAHIVGAPDAAAEGGDSVNSKAAGGEVLVSARGDDSRSSSRSSGGSLALSDSSEQKSETDTESEVDNDGSTYGSMYGSTGKGLPEDIGAVDQDAAEAPAVAWAPAADAEPAAAAATAAAAEHHTGTGDSVSEAGAQQQDEEVAQSVWLGRDLSHLMASGYRQWLHQRMLKATAVDVTVAAQLSAGATSARVTYSSAAELTAAAEALGVPLTLTQGVRYCYSLPSAPPTQYCQDYLPDMAYEGVITAHTRKGVRLYLVHLAYIHALQTRPSTQAAPVKDAPAPVAVV